MDKSNLLETILKTLAGHIENKKTKPIEKERIRCEVERIENLKLFVIKNAADIPNDTSYGAFVTEQVVDIVTDALPADTIDAPIAMWLSQLLNDHRLDTFSQVQFDRIVGWLSLSAKNLRNEAPQHVLAAFMPLFQNHPNFVGEYFNRMYDMDRMGILISCLENAYSSRDKRYVVVLLARLDIMLGCLQALPDFALDDNRKRLCTEVARAIFKQIFSSMWTKETCNGRADEICIDLLYMHLLQFLLKINAMEPRFISRNVSEVFSILKFCWQYGLNSNIFRKTPLKVNTSQNVVLEGGYSKEPCYPPATGRVQRTRKPRAVVKSRRHHLERPRDANPPPKDAESSMFLGDEVSIKTSDSEASENDAKPMKRFEEERRRHAKLRMAAINLVGNLSCTLERRTLYSYWFAMFPTDETSNSENREDLLFMGSIDPCARCRSNALQTCALLIYGAHSLLGQANCEKRLGTSTFVPYSVHLALAIEAKYTTLIEILNVEANLAVLTQGLKCLAVLIQATPFSQLDDGIVTQFLPVINTLIRHQNCSIQVAALMVLEFLVAVPTLNKEIADILGMGELKGKEWDKYVYKPKKTDSDEDVQDLVEYEENQKAIKKKIELIKSVPVDTEPLQQSWLFQYVIRLLTFEERNMRSPPVPVRVECYQIIVAMATHFVSIKYQLGIINKVLQTGLEDNLPDVRLAACRCIESVAYEMSSYAADMIIKLKATESPEAKEMGLKELQEMTDFWATMLPFIYKIFNNSQQNDQPGIKVCLCDAFANIGSTIYERLLPAHQTGILVFLSGTTGDDAEDVNVRAAALRALSNFVLFPLLKTDLVFVENTAELGLRLATDANLSVRIKAHWSLANVSEALVNQIINAPIPSEQEPEIEPTPLEERISPEVLSRLLSAASRACTDNDKVRCNAVRMLGNLLRLVGDRQMDNPIWRQYVKSAVSKVIDCIRLTSNSKVKWNACCSISNFMKNSALYTAAIKYTDVSWQDVLYPALCKLINNHANFKVRTNAAAIIVNIEKRPYFGKHFIPFWLVILKSIEESWNMKTFYEYNHRNGLQEQLCLSLAHLLMVAENSDFSPMYHGLEKNSEIVHDTWRSVANRLLPERVGPIASCTIRLREIIKSNEENADEVEFPLTGEQHISLSFLIQIFTTEINSN